MIFKNIKRIADNLSLISAAILSLKEEQEYNLSNIERAIENQSRISEANFAQNKRALSAICQNVYNENIRIEDIKELIKECFPKETGLNGRD